MTVHRRVLADADRALAVPPWSTIPDDLVDALNDHLAKGAAVLVPDGSGWRLSYASGVASARAAFALAQLVAQDGVTRIKRCDRCGRPFIDRTAGRTGKRCSEHRRLW